MTAVAMETAGEEAGATAMATTTMTTMKMITNCAALQKARRGFQSGRNGNWAAR